mmetsp:Transcript_25214/g.43077  ORF Transcript_25214/g.43077 Transcript_25214/m.43077 type:complete len:210 (+) Transcript_25214:323-952(+)
MRPVALSIVMTSPACTFSFVRESIIFWPRSYTVSMSVVFSVSLPVFPPAAPPAAGRSISISTTSPSIISVSSLIRTPIDRRNACVSASVLFISSEKISDAAIVVNGVSAPSACAIPIAIAVLPVPGWPAIRIARPAMSPSLIMERMTPAALRAPAWPTMPCETILASSASSRPRPRMCECAPIRSIRVMSFTSCIFTVDAAAMVRCRRA